MKNKQTVFVGLSGGVDSSVAAVRLKARGFDVVGVFIKVWHPEFMVCNWEQERLDAMRVAAHLGIPFLTCDAEAAYRDDVAHHFIEEYRAGRTPNPDVMCNQHVKFGAFIDFAKSRGADFIATGHYARRVEGKNGIELHRGVDNNKDQTYFLWTLNQEQLDYTLFPVGDSPKETIRNEAAAANMPTATKKDSQGICFLGHVDIPDFLSHYMELKEGSVLDTKGNVIGTHKGALVYTLGQRHGFNLQTIDANRPAMFVIDRNLKLNTITVGEETEKTKTEADMINLHKIVFRSPVKINDNLLFQYRYRQNPLRVTVANITADSLEIKPEEQFEKPAAGQSGVFYQDSHCIGGGVIV